MLRVIFLSVAALLWLGALVSLVGIVGPLMRMATDTSGYATGFVLGNLLFTATLAVPAGVLTWLGLRKKPESAGPPGGGRR